ncbi:uncharacterized protein Z519_05915 [Cladophialophora bantiana CBS 173.52]|uniref:Uncharacterized protein n=1 Tax=Cladophialophora bantiana (strain ATCC 10958 / CBS 173.52 / CDC B-1940 / NIH 8579) TaxID=1442370 RepID=A0A0D2HR30_CLAB1|nr:uncharacterized protein Z519_05915 [Cladophialophora bantiana CBS 173.52]KIW93310.1 hypothetical protein Z519_05915 [Cladophialophora bantiana CBS 173.52]
MSDFPLSSGDAEAPVRVSDRAAFGKGTQTLVDETVRKTWEIDRKKLTFKNECWNSWLDQVLESVSKGLGTNGIQSGYPFALTYIIINVAIERPLSVKVLDVKQPKIDGMFAEWSPMQDHPLCMYYALQDKYTGASIKLQSLNGDDYYRISHPDRACQSNGFCVFLSQLQLTMTRINDEEEGTKDLRLNNIVTQQGARVQDSLAIEADFFAPDLYEAPEHDE